MKTEVFRCGCVLSKSFLGGKRWTRCSQHVLRAQETGLVDPGDDDLGVPVGLALGQAFGNPGLGVAAIQAQEVAGGGGEFGGAGASESYDSGSSSDSGGGDGGGSGGGE